MSKYVTKQKYYSYCITISFKLLCVMHRENFVGVHQSSLTICFPANTFRDWFLLCPAYSLSFRTLYENGHFYNNKSIFLYFWQGNCVPKLGVYLWWQNVYYCSKYIIVLRSHMIRLFPIFQLYWISTKSLFYSLSQG